MKRDTLVFDIINQELARQRRGIELIASENFTSLQVMQAMGGVMTNKYAEGYPGKRYYGGCEIVDKDTIIVTSNSDHNRGIMFLNIANGKTIKHFDNLQHYPKDVCIVEDVLFIVCAASLPQIGQTTVIKESIVYAFDKNTLEKIDEVTFHGQTDSIVVNGEDGFITVQGDDTVVHFKFVDNKLHIEKRIGGFNFPHGIDYKNNKVAITNYGDNTIRIFDVNELIPKNTNPEAIFL